MMDAPTEVRVVKVGTEEVSIDPNKLKFNEQSLNEFMENLSLWYNYYGEKLADAEYVLQRYDQELDVMYSKKFDEYKIGKTAVATAEARVKSDPEYSELKKKQLTAKYTVKILQQHLKAWDKAHENAQSRGHWLRREMDKLSPNIYQESVDDKINKIIGSGETN
jgi:hypothetical protein